MADVHRYSFRPWLIATAVILLCAGTARGRLGLLGHCDFGIHQVQKSADDVQFYSDWTDPASWITFRGQPISSHAATRHFWLFLQVSDEELTGALLQAADLRRELEALLSRAGHEDEHDRRLMLFEETLRRHGQDVSAKGAYYEIILSHDPQAPDPNPVADFQMAYPGSRYFYVLVIYNLEMPEALDIIWSDIVVAISLSSFTAESGPGEVVLEWTTASERQNLGFHILRREGSRGSFQPLTEEAIPSAAAGYSLTPQSYRWVDRQVDPGMDYHYQLQDVGFDGQRTILGTVTAAPLSSGTAPRRFRLLQNYPNPFNAGTEISYLLPQASEVRIRIYDVNGRLVTTLVEGHCQAGRHAVRWDGRTETGHQAGSGLYFCSFQAGEYAQRMKMILLR